MSIKFNLKDIQQALESHQLDRLIIRKNVRLSGVPLTVLQQAKRSKVKIKQLMSKAFDKEYGESVNLVGILSAVDHVPIDHILQHPEQYPILVIVDHIQDPYNFGAIIRSADCLGARAIIYPKDRQCPITETVVQSAAGATNHIDICQVTNLSQAIQQLQSHQFWVYGSVPEGGSPLRQWQPNFPAALIISNEHKGLSSGLYRVVDDVIQIATVGKTASLNASVAAGILLHHVFDQKYS